MAKNRATYQERLRNFIAFGVTALVLAMIVIGSKTDLLKKDKSTQFRAKAGSLCSLTFSIPTPTPGITTAPSTTCKVDFTLPDTAVCWKSPIKSVPITYTVTSLPSTGGPFYMQTDWFLAAPTVGSHHYTETQLIQAGKTYTMYADWPGIPAGSTKTIEVHAGINVLNANKQIISPACADGLDYYWTPYVACPTP